MTRTLTAASQAAERLMLDRIVILDDPEQQGDDTFNRSTMQFERSGGDEASDSEPIYEGPGTLTPLADQGRGSSDQGGAQVYVDPYRLRVPVSVTNLALGQLVRCTAVDPTSGDPTLVDREFVIVKVRSSSYAVTRIAVVDARTRGPRT